MGAVVAKTEQPEGVDAGKNRAAMLACMEHLDTLQPEDARRVLRALLVWFEDEDERAALADGILESLGEIGRAIQEGLAS